MDKVDWSKAPEGATHYSAESDGYFAVWAKKNDFGHWMTWLADGDTCWDRDDSLGEIEHLLLQRPLPWNGTGLPPVGTVCEAAIPHTSGLDNERSFIWIEGRVIAYHEIKGNTYAWFAEDDGFYPPGVFEFRPIRTPEQIAAEEREKAVREMLCVFTAIKDKQAETMIGDLMAALYDAGFRKVEGGELAGGA